MRFVSARVFISETFYSLQGEGELTGVPSVFIRTSGCNLRCNWCDTPYASWDPQGIERSVEDLQAEVQRHRARHVVLTGGEPMLSRDLPVLAKALQEQGCHITIETAGTIPPAGIACDLASISPKLRNSTPDARASEGWRERHERTRWQPEVVRAWIDQYTYQIKFVVSSPEDLAEVEAMLGELARPIPPHKVLLMPEGTSVESLRARSAWLGEVCKERGFRFAYRLHVELYGNKRGT